MARKRMIDPGFYSDDKIIELEPVIRLLFIGMWNFANDEGVLKHSPKQLKARIFPADPFTPEQVSEWLMRLHEIGLILFNGDRSLMRVKGWKTYQKINRPQPSKYEFIDEVSEQSVNVPEPITPNRIEVNRKEENIIEDNIIPQKNGVMKTPDQKQDAFEQFYSLYPRKVSKQATIKAFKRLSKKDRDLIMEVLPKHIKMWIDKGTEMDFIPHPSTWLNQRKFEDVLDHDQPDLKQQDIEAKRKVEEEQQRAYFKELKEQQKNAASPEEISEIIGSITKKMDINK